MIDAPSEAITIFAYGSNMLAARMMARVPSVRLLGPASLERFVLHWNKRSKDGSGKCSIEETGRREEFVWGVLYALDRKDKRKLDDFEGLGRGYGERMVTVLAGGRPLRVWAYYATSIDLNVRPYDWYRDLVIAGAREHGMQPEYIQSLEAVPAVKDLDVRRAAEARELLRSVT